MLRNLALMRHGQATGQGPDAALLPEGAAQLNRLARRLADEGWQPGAIVTSPYRRARESANVVAAALGITVETHVLHELLPEGDPLEALDALLDLLVERSPILVVTHLPIVGLLVQGLTGEQVAFAPGTFAELQVDGEAGARLLRTIGGDGD